MTLHPDCKAFLDQLAAAPGPPMHELTPQEARRLTLPAELGGPERPMHRVQDRTIPGPAGPLSVRVYTPVDDGPLPGLVFLHGGGFVLGGLDMADRQCRDLAGLARCVVVSVDYRLAPEHKFPAAADDAYAAVQYVTDHAAEFGIDAAAVAVGGESAGGNLAAVAALRARDRGGPRLVFQLLVYPQVSFEDESPSMQQYAEGHFITRPLLDYFRAHYLRTPEDRRNPDASPLLAASLGNLPAALVITAECDPLRDQGEAYAAALQRAGVQAGLERYEGMIHPFFSLGGIIGAGRTVIERSAASLREAFERGRT